MNSDTDRPDEQDQGLRQEAATGHSLEGLLDTLSSLSKHQQDFAWEIEKMRAWKRYALAVLPFGEGDRVAIADSYPGPDSTSGWWPSREFLRPGHTGVARKIEISPNYLTIYAEVIFDREWTVSTEQWRGHPEDVRRYNSLLNYDGVTPKDRRHIYSFLVKHLRLATEIDVPFEMPLPEVVS